MINALEMIEIPLNISFVYILEITDLFGEFNKKSIQKVDISLSVLSL